MKKCVWFGGNNEEGISEIGFYYRKSNLGIIVKIETIHTYLSIYIGSI